MVMDTTYTCNVGATCAPDATDFYRMDPDGLRYFGGTGANAAGTQFSMTTFASPEGMLKHPVTPGTMMGGPGGGYQNRKTWQVALMGTSSITFAFTSPTTSTLRLPGGRVSHIQPQAW
jgi:hypothetical protein